MTNKGVILANPESRAWDFAKGICDLLNSHGSEFELDEVDILKFRDGEIRPRIRKNVRRRSCYFVHDSSLNPAEWFLELNLINSALKDSSAKEVIDVLPYLRFSRQDRKDESRVPISAKVVADCIGLYTDNVITLDLHSPQIQGFYDIPLDNLYSFPTAINYIKNNHQEILKDLVIMSADAGGTKRAEKFAHMLGMEEIVVGYKTRPKPGDVKEIRVLGDVAGKNIFIVDDIVDSGNTIVEAANAVRKAGGGKIYAYCTHGLFTKGVDYVTSKLDGFFVGDTMRQEQKSDLEIISFVPLFAQAIGRINIGESLSALFD